MKIGFIGLGIMGRPMALNLNAAQHSLLVYDRASLADDIRAAAEVEPDGKTVAAKSEVVILMVPDTPDVENVLFAPNGVAEGLKPGTLVIDMSSISPIETKEFAKKINALGCDYLDAPVSGGEVGAKQATLTIMVGGPEAAFARAKPLFDLMGKNITHVGAENGAGQTCKVANQIIVALNIQAVSEALVFAAKAGADPAKVRAALMGGFAVFAHPGGARRAHAERHVQSGLPHPAAPEGPQPGAVGGEGTRPVAAQHGDRAADVLVLCRAWRGRSGPFGADPGDRGPGRLFHSCKEMIRARRGRRVAVE